MVALILKHQRLHWHMLQLKFLTIYFLANNFFLFRRMFVVFLVAWIGFCTLMDVAKPTIRVVDPKVIECFSLYRNAHYLYKMDSSSNSIKCLDGLRVLSILWIMLAHRMFIMAFIPTSINHKWFIIVSTAVIYLFTISAC